MNLKQTTLSVAIGSVLGLGAANVSQAAIIDMDYEGLVSLLDPGNRILSNTSKPYYYDTTWGYGVRTQISGTMSFNTVTGSGTGTIQPFEFLSAGPAVASGVSFQAIGDGFGNPGSLVIGNMLFSWAGNNISTNIVLDASGLFGALSGSFSTSTVIDQAACAGLPCATPASNMQQSPFQNIEIGPVPIATTSFNVAGSTGFGTTIGQLSLGTDDGIGGSPLDNGPFSGFNVNLDFTSLTVTNISDVPIPASIWLFGSGLLALSNIARRKKQR